MVKLSANCGDPDQTPLSVVSDLYLHCLPIILLGFQTKMGQRNNKERLCTTKHAIQFDDDDDFILNVSSKIIQVISG